jgi:hypothetical protein
VPFPLAARAYPVEWTWTGNGSPAASPARPDLRRLWLQHCGEVQATMAGFTFGALRRRSRRHAISATAIGWLLADDRLIARLLDGATAAAARPPAKDLWMYTHERKQEAATGER